MTKFTVLLTGGKSIVFTGSYSSGEQNWSIYKDEMGNMYRFRKEHIVAIIEEYAEEV